MAAAQPPPPREAGVARSFVRRHQAARPRPRARTTYGKCQPAPQGRGAGRHPNPPPAARRVP
eukprot:scaffold580_cov63-Phaeocystis_antarctica.AAC.4